MCLSQPLLPSATLSQLCLQLGHWSVHHSSEVSLLPSSVISCGITSALDKAGFSSLFPSQGVHGLAMLCHRAIHNTTTMYIHMRSYHMLQCWSVQCSVGGGTDRRRRDGDGDKGVVLEQHDQQFPCSPSSFGINIFWAGICMWILPCKALPCCRSVGCHEWHSDIIAFLLIDYWLPEMQAWRLVPAAGWQATKLSVMFGKLIWAHR